MSEIQQLSRVKNLKLVSGCGGGGAGPDSWRLLQGVQAGTGRGGEWGVGTESPYTIVQLFRR